MNLENKLKESFKTSATYLTENIYLNRKVKKGEESFYGLLKTFKAKPFEYDGVVGRGGEDVLFDGVSSDKSVVSRAFSYTRHCRFELFDGKQGYEAVSRFGFRRPQKMLSPIEIDERVCRKLGIYGRFGCLHYVVSQADGQRNL